MQRVIVGGHSFGANAAIAYAGSGGDSDGILAMAPGHSPLASYNNGTTKDTVDHARQLMAAGRGNESLNFIDTNQAKHRHRLAVGITQALHFWRELAQYDRT